MLNQAIKRNEKRFPTDFMFQMTSEELSDWKSQNVISNKEKMGLRKPPNVFTEQGVAILSSVLNSETAIEVNIHFTRIRQMLSEHIELRLEVEKIKKKQDNQDKNMEVVFQYLDELLEKKDQPKLECKSIGYKINPGKTMCLTS